MGHMERHLCIYMEKRIPRAVLQGRHNLLWLDTSIVQTMKLRSTGTPIFQVCMYSIPVGAHNKVRKDVHSNVYLLTQM